MLQFNTQFDIVASNVDLNDELIAVAFGDLFGPSFELSSESRLPANELTNVIDIYDAANIVDLAIFEMVALGGCLGGEDVILCGALNSGS